MPSFSIKPIQVLQDQGSPAPHLEVRELHRLHPGGLDHLYVEPRDPVGNKEPSAYHQLAVIQLQPILYILWLLNTSRFLLMGESEN